LLGKAVVLWPNDRLLFPPAYCSFAALPAASKSSSSIPVDEEPLAAARREFQEETGIEPDGDFLPLGTIQQKAGKLVHAWAFAGDADADSIKSNLTRVEIPRGSGRWIEVPEVDRAGWFAPAIAREKINPAQAEFIDRLLALEGADSPG
jgi:predicted NUDIX family NTP pyrophosphohydrolase